MNNEDKKKQLNEYKKFLYIVKNKEEKTNSLSSQFNQSLKANKTRKLVKKENGFTNIMIPIVITVFIIGFAIGIAFAIYKF